MQCGFVNACPRTRLHSPLFSSTQTHVEITWGGGGGSVVFRKLGAVLRRLIRSIDLEENNGVTHILRCFEGLCMSL